MYHINLVHGICGLLTITLRRIYAVSSLYVALCVEASSATVPRCSISMSREQAVADLIAAARANTLVRPEIVSVVIDLPIKSIQLMTRRGTLPGMRITSKKTRYSARKIATLAGIVWETPGEAL